MSPNPKLIDKWLASLPREARRAISGIIATADASDTSLYLVGGPVRDLLLDRPSLDVDLVVERDAIEFAQRAAHYLEAAVKTHPPFRTASVILRNEGSGAKGPAPGSGTTPSPVRPEALGQTTARPGVGRADDGRPDHHHPLTIDIATARTETYARPGALPKITPATIDDDLHRRDFTINAIALRLNGPGRDELLDPTNGIADLEGSLIRTLHNHSFQDDPTRILRAARYVARLDVRIERRTLGHLKRDSLCLQRVSGARLHHEFARILDEPAPETTFRHLDRLGVLRAVHPALHFERQEAAAFQRLKAFADQERMSPPGIRAAYWPALALRLTPADTTTFATRLALTATQRAAVEAMPQIQRLASQLYRHSLPRSAIAGLLAPFPFPAVWAFAAASTGRIRNRTLDYLTTARHIHPILRGDDLIALGVPQGPAVGDILHRLRAAKLDGEVKTKTDEIRLVRTINKVGDLNGGSVVGQ